MDDPLRGVDVGLILAIPRDAVCVGTVASKCRGRRTVDLHLVLRAARHLDCRVLSQALGPAGEPFRGYNGRRASLRHAMSPNEQRQVRGTKPQAIVSGPSTLPDNAAVA